MYGWLVHPSKICYGDRGPFTWCDDHNELMSFLYCHGIGWAMQVGTWAFHHDLKGSSQGFP